MATARKWFGFISPPSPVTMPWRSESASLPVATSNGASPEASGVMRVISDAMALGEEQSMRIFPSQSRVMNPNCGSTSGFTTVSSRPWREPISAQ